jgi:hypothetical protein
LSPCSDATPSGSTSVTTTPSDPLPATSPAGATVGELPKSKKARATNSDSDAKGAGLPKLGMTVAPAVTGYYR